MTSFDLFLFMFKFIFIIIVGFLAVMAFPTCLKWFLYNTIHYSIMLFHLPVACIILYLLL